MKCVVAPLGPRVKERESNARAIGMKELSPHLRKCEIHKSTVEIQEKVGFSKATVPGGLRCIGVDVEVSLS